MHYGLLSLRAERIENNKGKHLIFKCLPRISLIFNIQGLTFNRTLSRRESCNRYSKRRA